MAFLREARLRARLAWACLRGRRTGLYAHLLAERPLAFRVKARGLEAAGGAILVECVAADEALTTGISVGPGSHVIACTVVGMKEYGVVVRRGS